MYENKITVLATKHRKEIAIAPPFEQTLKTKIMVPDDYDTDQFGTFTGEIARRDDAETTAIQKAQHAAALFGYPCAIASEGSFGPHPSCVFLPSDMEILVFVDLENNYVIKETMITTETNYAQLEIKRGDDYQAFLQKAKFGSHGMMIRNMASNEIVAKGVTDRAKLDQFIQLAFREAAILRLETDMRAMLNPTRIQVISTLAQKLAARVATHCRVCNAPGFGQRVLRGKLACSWCGTEGRQHQHEILQCIQCDYEEVQARADGLQYSDPSLCDVCNP